MDLNQYYKKRNCSKTPEPKGDTGIQCARLFVIQKHAASHLHYDFRLELRGILKSWAVPKGPSLDPQIKRLAIQVEDHPIEYGFFEGIIPKGQYGSGTVMLWDKGTWESLDEDPYNAYKKGHLRFNLHAEKLNGRWDLIRFKDENHWFLIKHQDKYAKKQAEYDITNALTKSIKTNYTIEELADYYTHIGHNSNAKEVTTNELVCEFETPLKEIKKEELSKTQTRSTFIITHPDKILYPEDNISKQEILYYYEQISEYILPYLALRPLTLVRCPTNYNQCFYQRHYNKTTAKALHAIEDSQNKEHYIYLNDKQGLLSLVQMNVLEIHPWGSTIKHLEQPDMLTIDLDPAPDVSWSKLVKAAQEIKNHLSQYHLTSFVKTTGGKGLHVVIPIVPEYGWEEVKEFTHIFVQFLEQFKPDEYIGTMSKAKRKGKIFIDYLRNQRAATAISAYSTRARPHAPISVPLDWNELSPNIKDNTYTIKTLPKRLSNLKKDPWENFWTIKQSLRLKDFK